MIKEKWCLGREREKEKKKIRRRLKDRNYVSILDGRVVRPQCI